MLRTSQNSRYPRSRYRDLTVIMFCINSKATRGRVYGVRTMAATEDRHNLQTKIRPLLLALLGVRLYGREAISCDLQSAFSQPYVDINSIYRTISMYFFIDCTHGLSNVTRI